jgi:hypothetical protein
MTTIDTPDPDNLPADLPGMPEVGNPDPLNAPELPGRPTDPEQPDQPGSGPGGAPLTTDDAAQTDDPVIKPENS